MNAGNPSEEFGAILVTQKTDGLTVDTTVKDRLAVLVSPAGRSGNIRATSNLKQFANSKNGAKVPNRLVLQVSRCADVFEGLCEMFNLLQEYPGLLKNTLHLDISFVAGVNSKGDTSANDTKAIADELTRLLPNVTSFRCTLGIESNFTMLTFASFIADRYATQLVSLVCHWKILGSMTRVAEKLSSLESLVIGGESKISDSYKSSSISLPKLNRLSVDICPYTLSFLLNVQMSESIAKVGISVSNTLFFDMTNFKLTEEAKKHIIKHCTYSKGDFDMIVFSDHLLAQDEVAKDVTAYINKELLHDDVDVIYWNKVTKLVVTACIGLGDVLRILHNSPDIRSVDAKKIIFVFEDEGKQLFDALDDSKAAGNMLIREFAAAASRYKGELPADLCKVISCRKVEGRVVDRLREWANHYVEWLNGRGVDNIYQLYSDKLELEGVEYHFARSNNKDDSKDL